MKVELISVWGDDNTVCDCARVSFNKRAENYSKENNEKLINYLVKHKHTSVFRHPQVQFRIVCPIYVERQLFKHQVGMSANSISGRYVDFSDTYTLIHEWRTQSLDSKQGSAEPLDIYGQETCNEIEYSVKEFCQNAYKKLIEFGVSKEQARTILPLNLNTQFIWTGSLLAYINFWKLRITRDTQLETMQIAMDMLCELKLRTNDFEHSLKAFHI